MLTSTLTADFSVFPNRTNGACGIALSSDPEWISNTGVMKKLEEFWKL
jgi:hypothetical protein